MAETEQQEQAKQVALPPKVKADVIEYARLDDGLKQARGEMKEARKSMTDCRERIIDFMKESEIERLSMRKGTQYLELQEKQLKVRATSDEIKAKLREVLAAGATDPDYIFEQVNNCGGTKTVWKLARRSKRKAGEKSKKKAEADGAPAAKKKKKTKTTVAASED